MKDLAPIVSHNLTELRKSRGITQGQLAEKFAYTDKSISKWERGEALPDLNTLQELADFYGVTLDYLTHEESDVSLQEEGKHDPAAIRINKIVLTSLGVVFVWTLASVFFAGFLLFPRHWTAWMAFVWAVPMSLGILWIFNRVWGSLNYQLGLSISFTATLFAAIYLEVSLDLASWNMWFLVLIAVPMIIGEVFADRLHHD
jgi:transcriptional regulator with XRE-family HTH domain